MATKTCTECNQGFEAKGRATRCTLCRSHDPHDHHTRRKRLPSMFVSVDGEGRQTDDHMFMITFSFAREDGTAATHVVQDNDIAALLLWLMDNLSGPYVDKDGRVWRQVVVGFHFGWDAAVLAKSFNPANMAVIHKVQSTIETALCRDNHTRTEPCPMRAVHGPDKSILHVYRAEDVTAVISGGGETDLVSWDQTSQLALAITPGRRFYVEHRPMGDRYETWRRVDVHDTGSAFTGGLLKVISDWNPELTPEQHAAIEWGKVHRTNTFENATDKQITAYSEAECVAHARTCRILLTTIRDTAHIPLKESNLYGSGSVAGAALKHHRVPKRDRSDLAHEDIGQMTYFGGMIETPVLGLVAGSVDELDINSAYPHKMLYIPCVKSGCGGWVETRREPRGVVLGHCLVDWDVTDVPTSTPPFIVRDKHMSVYQPPWAEKIWVSLAEYQAAVERFGSRRIALHKAIYWEAACICDHPTPFDFLGQLYDQRLSLKTTMKLEIPGTEAWRALSCRELVIKLIINSIYGKLAQRRPTFGAYTNLHLASYITGATRAQVRRETWAREAQGGTVVYQHTDSVLSIGGDPQDGGKALGAWGREKSSQDFLILQPGLALTMTGPGKNASRGAALGSFQRAVEAWLPGVDLTTPPHTWPPLSVERQVMVSRKQALARNKPELAGSFQASTLNLSMATRKRNVMEAVQMVDCPTAWVIPPIAHVPNPATLEDIKSFQTEIEKLGKPEQWHNQH